MRHGVAFAGKYRLVFALGFLVALGPNRNDLRMLASVEDFHDAAQDHPDLSHQYTFDGDTPEERRALLHDCSRRTDPTLSSVSCEPAPIAMLRVRAFG